MPHRPRLCLRLGALLPALLLALPGAAENEREVLAEEPAPIPMAAAPGAPLGEVGSVRLRFGGPPPEGNAWRIVHESSGEQQLEVSTDRKPREPLQSTDHLELEYRELPLDEVEGTAEMVGAYKLVLDALHFRRRERMRGSPPTEGEVELGEDRLRTFKDGKAAIDLKGSLPKEKLSPRKLIGRAFAVVGYDEAGEPVSIQPRGIRTARQFLGNLPVKPAIAFSRVPLPNREIRPGDYWRARRFPLNPAGASGLEVTVNYTLGGFQELEGVPCAWIVFSADQNDENVRSAAGFSFDRVLVKLRGEAWVELATGQLVRMVVEDEVRASLTRGEAPAPVAVQRYRFKGRLLRERRDAEDEKPERWADGGERFARK